MKDGPRPITVLIAAMGGEGGGVLTDWIVKAAEDAGVLVQSTSIPGVAQRTGATTYYVEIFPVPSSELNDRKPVFALYPAAGDIDVMIASELLEAGRAIQNGFVSPDRTTLIASTHRVYTIGERSDMADGRLDEERLRKTATELAQHAVLDDMRRIAEEVGSVLNAVLLGALAAAPVAPMVKKENFISAIRAGGKAVGSNLAGFEAGFELVSGVNRPVTIHEADSSCKETAETKTSVKLGSLGLDIGSVPKSVREIMEHGIQRVASFQDQAYAQLYIDRVALVSEIDPENDKSLTKELARQLALRMAYEDVVRVAQLKTLRERTDKVRAEVGAGSAEPIQVTEFLKPGIEEACSLLPGIVARPLLRWSSRKNLIDKLHIGLAIKSSSITGFFVLWFLARLRPLRRWGHRYGEEQQLIESWIKHVCAAGAKSPELALRIVSCARLIKGYGETHRRGLDNYKIIEKRLINPALDGQITLEEAINQIGEAVEVALSDPGGSAVGDTFPSQAAAGSVVGSAAE